MKKSWSLLLAFLCVALVVFWGSVQVVHAHPLGDVSTHEGCLLCATAHVASETAQPPVVLLVTVVTALVEPSVPPVRSSTLSTFALYTRPPPADEAFI